MAIAAPDWLAKRLKKDWFDHYGRRVENYRLPKLDSEREALGNQMGEDGFDLLKGRNIGFVQREAVRRLILYPERVIALNVFF